MIGGAIAALFGQSHLVPPLRQILGGQPESSEWAARSAGSAASGASSDIGERIAATEHLHRPERKRPLAIAVVVVVDPNVYGNLVGLGTSEIAISDELLCSIRLRPT